MRALALLLAIGVVRSAVGQDAYWRTDSVGDSLRWSAGAELLRPVLDLLTHGSDDAYRRVEVFGQYWLRPDIALRLSVAGSDEHIVTEEPTYYTDSAAVTRRTTEDYTGWRASVGTVIQKRRAAFVDRERKLAPLLGLMLLVGREDRSLRNEDQAYALDSTGMGAPIPGTAVTRSEEDRLLYAGLEVSPGISGPLGRRWELELRLPIEVTWWSVLEQRTLNRPDVPDWWYDPVNFGIRLPRIFLHYRW